MALSKERGSLRQLVLGAQMAAVVAVCSQIVVPLPFTPVPVNLATLAVMLTGLLLGARGGAVCIGVYLLLGSVGLPVFHAFQGGLGVLLGPTGGYLMGYPLLAAAAGVFARRTGRCMPALGLVVGNAGLYLLGTAWFMSLTGRGFWEALLLCVVPFLPGDSLKCAGALLLHKRLRGFVEARK